MASQPLQWKHGWLQSHLLHLQNLFSVRQQGQALEQLANQLAVPFAAPESGYACGQGAQRLFFAECFKSVWDLCASLACYMCMSCTAQVAHHCVAAVGNVHHCWLRRLLRRQQPLCRLCSACGNAAVGDMLDAWLLPKDKLAVDFRSAWMQDWHHCKLGDTNTTLHGCIDACCASADDYPSMCWSVTHTCKPEKVSLLGLMLKPSTQRWPSDLVVRFRLCMQPAGTGLRVGMVLLSHLLGIKINTPLWWSMIACRHDMTVLHNKKCRRRKPFGWALNPYNEKKRWYMTGPSWDSSLEPAVDR